MSKLIITAPKSCLGRAIQELYKLKAVHIINHSAAGQAPQEPAALDMSEMHSISESQKPSVSDDAQKLKLLTHAQEHVVLDIGAPLESASKISETLIAVRALISNLSLKNGVELKNGFSAIGVKNFAQLAKAVKALQEETNSKLERINQIESEAKAAESKKNLMLQLSKLELPLESYSGYASITFFTGHVRDAGMLEKELSGGIDEFQLHSAKEGNRHIIALFVANSSKEKAAEILSRNGFSEMDMSLAQGISGSPSEALSAISARHERLIKSLNETKRQLHRLSEKWRDFLLLSEKLLSIELEKAEAPLRFAESENIFVITGWVPSKNLQTVSERLQRITNGNICIETSKPSGDEEVPVKLSNRRQAQPFEFLMNLYALPRYDEIDPTLFLSITFPLFFGIILGDVGYGAVTALLLLYLSKKLPKAAPLAKVMIPAALSSIFFGFIFGEIFGFEELFGYQLPHLISRLHQINQMLIISIIIGAIHVNTGILLGFINELNHHGLKRAVLAKGSWWVMQSGAVLAALSSTGILPAPIYLAGIIIMAGIAMLLLGEPMEIVEIPAIISNILSYSRLMAVGLASVGLAVVVNGFIEEFASAGGIMIIAAIIIGVAGHLLNIALGLLGGFLHSIRLHYVEFFTKFFKGGAIPFNAFGKRGAEEAAET